MAINVTVTTTQIPSLYNQIKGSNDYFLDKNIDIQYGLTENSFDTKLFVYIKGTREQEWQDISDASGIICSKITKRISIDLPKVADIGEIKDFQCEIKIGFAALISAKVPDEVIELSQTFRRPLKFSEDYFKYTINTDKINSMAIDGFYKESLNISAYLDRQALNVPFFGAFSYAICPAIDEVSISITNNTKTKTFPFKGFSVVSEQNNTSIDMMSAFLPEIGNEATIKFIIKDKAQREIIINTQTPYKKAGNLSFSGDISSSSSSIKPYSNLDNITITSPSLEVPSGSKNVELVYNFKIGTTVENIGKREWSPDGNTTYSISSNDVNANLVSLLKNYLNFSDTEAVNDVYNVILEVQAQDGFSIITLSTIIVADFIESPTLSGDLQLKHGDSTLDNGSNLSMRMFNQGESVILSFEGIGKVDPNNDIITYEIFLGTTDSSINTSDFVYSRLTSVNSISDNFNYIIGSLDRNQNYKFKIRAIDSKGNYSNEIISQTYIIGCRTTTPRFTISNISTASQGDGTLVSFNFTLNDLGGSSSGTWNPSFYQTYQNFNRAEYDSGRSLTLKVDIGTNGQNLNHSGNYFVDSAKNYLEFNPTSIFVSGISKTDIMYACFTLTISYGQENKQVQAVSQVYIIGNIPTVSYRQNQLGINTKEIPSDSVLTIDAITGKSKIFMRSLTNQEIEIDLDTGSIKGIKLDNPTFEGVISGVVIQNSEIENITINCGSW